MSWKIQYSASSREDLRSIYDYNEVGAFLCCKSSSLNWFYTDEEMEYLKNLIRKNAPLIIEFSQEGGILNASIA